MKKLLVALIAMAAVFTASSAMAEERAYLPWFDVTLNGQKIDNVNREYPMFVYNGVTYFPLTYYDCRFMGLNTKWDEPSGSLDVITDNIGGAYRDYVSDKANPESWPVAGAGYAEECVSVTPYETRVNGMIPGGEKYPFLIFRGVTYLPLTWDCAHVVFGWDYSFTEEDGLVISSVNYRAETLDLPGFDGASAAIYDGYYFYQAGQEIRRVPVGSAAAAETVYTVPLPMVYDYENSPRDGSMSNPVQFYLADGRLCMTYYDFDTATFTDYYYMKYDPVSNTFVDNDRPPAKHFSVGMGYTYYYSDGLTVTRRADAVSYEIDGREVSLLNKLYALGDVRLVGYNLYVQGRMGDETGIFRINTDTDEIKLVKDEVDSFFAFGTEKGDVLLTCSDGCLTLTDCDTGESRVIDGNAGAVTNAALGDGAVVVAADRGENTVLTVYSDMGMGTKREIAVANNPVTVQNLDGSICLINRNEDPDELYRTIVVSGEKTPYLTADMAGDVFKNGDTVIYVTDGMAVRVDLK